MPATIAAKSVTGLLLELANISELISQNTDEAASKLKAFVSRNEPLKFKQVKAQVNLLSLVIASVRNDYAQQGIDDQKLINYFTAEKKYDEAAEILLAKARHFFQNGNLAEGEKVIHKVRYEYLDKISLRLEIVYYTRLAFIYTRKHQHDNVLNVSLSALAKLNSVTHPTAWHYNISTIFYTNIAGCYLYNSDFENALRYLEKSLVVTEKPHVSTYNKFNIYSHFAFYYEAQKDYRQSAEWQEKIIALLKGDKIHTNYLIQSYFFAIIQYSLLFRWAGVDSRNRKTIAARQRSYLNEVSKLVTKNTGSGNYIMLLYVTAMLEHQQGNQSKAHGLLNRCVSYYEKTQHRSYTLNCYRLKHEILYAWGIETNHAKKLAQAYLYKKKESDLMEEDSQQSHLQKMDAVKMRYNLQQEELNGRLLKQQVEAMNKEIQLSALNLQEKIAVLDEVKAFVQSLKKKGNTQTEVINAITRKISSVKITEQDKAVIQQKIDDGNHKLFRIVSEKYPALTPHEVRGCGLIKTGLTNKELSKLYGLGERGYEQLRHRIKKKMKLKRADNLVKHLMALSAQQPNN